MEYVRLGRTGLKVSKLCLGCLSFGSPDWLPWVLDEADSRPILARAIEAGINFFDTAEMYSNGVGEQVLGRALKDLARRDELVVASKVWFPQTQDPNDGGLSRKQIFRAIDRSLKHLGMDYVDLYQIHRFDYTTPIEETLEALNDIVRAGKVRYIGASSMYAWQFAKMLYTQEREGWARFISMQPMYNLIYREDEREMLPLCLDAGVGVIPWSPIAGGFLTGRYTRDAPADSARARSNAETGIGNYSSADYDVADAVVAVAQAHERPPAQVAQAWVLSQPAVTAPIVGVSKLSHLEDALNAMSLKLSPEEIAALDRPYQAKRTRAMGEGDHARMMANHRRDTPLHAS
jgi:aryl-alcohol dehydrogenase-like predicted oxidoreductase